MIYNIVLSSLCIINLLILVFIDIHARRLNEHEQIMRMLAFTIDQYFNESTLQHIDNGRNKK